MDCVVTDLDVEYFSSSLSTKVFCTGYGIEVHKSDYDILLNRDCEVTEAIIDLCLQLFLSQIPSDVRESVWIMPLNFYSDYVNIKTEKYKEPSAKQLATLGVVSFQDPNIRVIVVPICKDYHYSCIIFDKTLETNNHGLNKAWFFYSLKIIKTDAIQDYKDEINR